VKIHRPGFPAVYDAEEAAPAPVFVKSEKPLPSIERAMELARARHAMIHPTQESNDGQQSPPPR
jgi:hypothetical protein